LNSHIKIAGLGKSFAHKQVPVIAFENIDLDIRHGEFVAIVGPSGCGKTSLLRIIAGLDQQSNGRVELEKNHQGKESQVGMIFQEHGLFPWMSLWKNIKFVLENNPRVDKKDVSNISDSFIKKVGLEKFAQYFPHQVSGGMRQRVTVARSFANNPDILLMDEPFVYLDYQSRLSLHVLLKELWKETKKTILFVTHDIEEAVLLANRVVVLSAGPARIREQFEINLDDSSDLLEKRKTSEFRDTVNSIIDLIRFDLKL